MRLCHRIQWHAIKRIRSVLPRSTRAPGRSSVRLVSRLWTNPESSVPAVLQETARLVLAVLGLDSKATASVGSADSADESSQTFQEKNTYKYRARLTLLKYISKDEVPHPSQAREGTTVCTSTVYWSDNGSDSGSDDSDPPSSRAWLSSEIPTPPHKSHHQQQNAGGEKTGETARPMGKLEVFLPAASSLTATSINPQTTQQKQRQLSKLATRLGTVVSHKETTQGQNSTFAALSDRERRLVESQRLAKIGQWELDLTNNSLLWSDGVFEIFRVDPTKFGASYEAFLDAIHPDDRDFVDNSYTNSLKTKKSYNIIHRLLFFDDQGEPETRWVNETCRTEYDPRTGAPLYSVGIVQDITQLKQAQEMNRLKSAFLANMSHEIRTPLNAIMGYTDLLLVEVNDNTINVNTTDSIHSATQSNSNCREYLKTIRQSGELLMTVISDILDISKIEAGQLHIDCRPYSPSQILEVAGQSAKAFQVNVARKKVHMELIREGDCRLFARPEDIGGDRNIKQLQGPPHSSTAGQEHPDQVEHKAISKVMGDPQRIQQVLNNLLVNAVKFTASQEAGRQAGRVEYGYRLVECQVQPTTTGDKEDKDNEDYETDTGSSTAANKTNTQIMMEFFVSDNGVGIPEETQETIFEAFRQVHPSRDSHELGGTGLGLTISKWLVELMGGRMRLWSSTHSVYHGTTVYFTVPYRPVPSSERVVRSPSLLSTAKSEVSLIAMNNQSGSRSYQALGLNITATDTPASPACGDITLDSSTASASESAPVPRVISPGTTPGGKVLVVDDNKVNLKLATRIVNKLGYETATATNGKEAVAQFQKDPSIRLILMDKEMPVMDGIQAVREIRRIERDEKEARLPVIALTAAAYREDEDACLAAGCDAYLTKQVKRQDLQRALSVFWNLVDKNENGSFYGKEERPTTSRPDESVLECSPSPGAMMIHDEE